MILDMFGESPAQAVAGFQAGMDQRRQQFQQFSATLNTMAPSQAKLAQTVQVIERLSQIEQFAQGHRPKAQSLSQAGHPELEQRVSAAVDDIHSATKIYVEMYQGTMQTMAQMRQVMNDAQQAVIVSQLAAVFHSQQVFDAARSASIRTKLRQHAVTWTAQW